MATSLICITTCNRLEEIKKFIFPIIDFCNHNDKYDFLLSLDGNNADYQSFSNQFNIPLLYSDCREGVGLAKNRVLKQFPGYDYYFFLEDDIELLNPGVFDNHIDFSKTCNTPHLSYTVFGESTTLIVQERWHVLQGYHSGAQFSFFEAKALFKVGGWNTLFAKYKRFGHTEHSYRFYNSNLQPFPFIALKSTFSDFILHDPPHVTILADDKDFDYHPEEIELIKAKIKFTPVKIISPYHFNGYNMGYNTFIAEFLSKNKRRYPLTKGKNRCIALAEFNFGRFERELNIFNKIKYFLLSLFHYPFSAPMKHFMKANLRMFGKP